MLEQIRVGGLVDLVVGPLEDYTVSIRREAMSWRLEERGA